MIGAKFESLSISGTTPVDQHLKAKIHLGDRVAKSKFIEKSVHMHHRLGSTFSEWRVNEDNIVISVFDNPDDFTAVMSKVLIETIRQGRVTTKVAPTTKEIPINLKGFSLA